MIILDVETTGLYPEKNSIVSIGAVDFESRSTFYEECRIWDGAEIDQKALEVNGFTEEQIKDSSKKSLEEAVKEFLDWTKPCEDKTLAGENPSFDRDFLMSSAKRANLNYIFGIRTIDLHSICYKDHLKKGFKIPLQKERSAISLDKTLEYVGLTQEPKPHNALNGAMLEAEAFSRLIYGKPFFEVFENYPIPSHLLADK